MKVRGKVTPKIARRVNELRSSGMSYRDIVKALAAEGFGLSLQGVSDVVKRTKNPKGNGKGARGGSTKGKGASARKEPPGSEREPREGEETEPKPVEASAEEHKRRRERAEEMQAAMSKLAPMPDLPPDASPAARLLWEDIREVREAAAMLRGSVFSEEYSATQWSSLKERALKMMRVLHEMLPAPKQDPKHNANNIAARELLLDRIYRKVRSHGGRARVIGR